MSHFARVRLEGIDRDLVSRDVRHDDGELLALADYPAGATVALEDWTRHQDAVFRADQGGWRQIYAVTWPLWGDYFAPAGFPAEFPDPTAG